MFYIYAAYYCMMVSIVIYVQCIYVFYITPLDVLFLHVGTDE